MNIIQFLARPKTPKVEKERFIILLSDWLIGYTETEILHRIRFNHKIIRQYRCTVFTLLLSQLKNLMKYH